MTLQKEELAAFADGELDSRRTREVAALVAADPALAAEVEAHRALRQKLSAHFAPVLGEPVPEEMVTMLQPKDAVIDFAAAKAARFRRRLPRWTWVAAPALAASLALALFAPGNRSPGPNYVSGQLASALDNQLSSTQPGNAGVRILLSFRDSSGAYCRAFAAIGSDGIACRDSVGWKMRFAGRAADRQSREFRQAGSGAIDLLSAAQEMAKGPALNKFEEEKARTANWQH